MKRFEEADNQSKSKRMKYDQSGVSNCSNSIITEKSPSDTICNKSRSRTNILRRISMPSIHKLPKLDSLVNRRQPRNVNSNEKPVPEKRTLSRSDLMNFLESQGVLNSEKKLIQSNVNLTIRLVMSAINVEIFSYQTIFEWIISSIKTKYTTYSEKFSKQFDAYKILYQILTRVVDMNNGKLLLDLISLSKYNTPQKIFSWYLIFREIPPVFERICFADSLTQQVKSIREFVWDLKTQNNCSSENKQTSDSKIVTHKPNSQKNVLLNFINTLEKSLGLNKKQGKLRERMKAIEVNVSKGQHRKSRHISNWKDNPEMKPLSNQLAQLQSTLVYISMKISNLDHQYQMIKKKDYAKRTNTLKIISKAKVSYSLSKNNILQKMSSLLLSKVDEHCKIDLIIKERSPQKSKNVDLTEDKNISEPVTTSPKEPSLDSNLSQVFDKDVAKQLDAVGLPKHLKNLTPDKLNSDVIPRHTAKRDVQITPNPTISSNIDPLSNQPRREYLSYDRKKSPGHFHEYSSNEDGERKNILSLDENVFNLHKIDISNEHELIRLDSVNLGLPKTEIDWNQYSNQTQSSVFDYFISHLLTSDNFVPHRTVLVKMSELLTKHKFQFQSDKLNDCDYRHKYGNIISDIVVIKKNSIETQTDFRISSQCSNLNVVSIIKSTAETQSQNCSSFNGDLFDSLCVKKSAINKTTEISNSSTTKFIKLTNVENSTVETQTESKTENSTVETQTESKTENSTVETQTESKTENSTIETQTESKTENSTVETQTESKTENSTVETQTESKTENSTVETQTESKTENSTVETQTESKTENSTVETQTESKIENSTVETQTESKTENSTVETQTESKIDGSTVETQTVLNEELNIGTLAYIGNPSKDIYDANISTANSVANIVTMKSNVETQTNCFHLDCIDFNAKTVEIRTDVVNDVESYISTDIEVVKANLKELICLNQSMLSKLNSREDLADERSVFPMNVDDEENLTIDGLDYESEIIDRGVVNPPGDIGGIEVRSSNEAEEPKRFVSVGTQSSWKFPIEMTSLQFSNRNDCNYLRGELYSCHATLVQAKNEIERINQLLVNEKSITSFLHKKLDEAHEEIQKLVIVWQYLNVDDIPQVVEGILEPRVVISTSDKLYLDHITRE